MSSGSKLKYILRRYRWYFIAATPCVLFALAPFPGMGMIFPIKDALRGHPAGRHGTQPQKLVGLWIRDEVVMYDFGGQAFYLMADGRVAGRTGMTFRRWHFDNDRLFIDSVSGCGNCYSGNHTSEYTIKFVGKDELLITNRDKDADWGVNGTYQRVQITDALRSNMERLKESPNEAESYQARVALDAIDQVYPSSKPED